MDEPLVFLKLGGSLITEKDSPRTPRPEVILRLAQEIAAVLKAAPQLRILLGHGSGSFGHTPARQYQTRSGVQGAAGWQGFTAVWREARALNQIVLEALAEAGVPAMAFPPSATMLARDGKAVWVEVRPLIAALMHGLVPVVQGDVAFDTRRGGTILSTEDVFTALTPRLGPGRILLAGIEEGVWADFPQCSRLIKTLTPASLSHEAPFLFGSRGIDVTGGMREKVLSMLQLVDTYPALTVSIFSAVQPGVLQAALLGQSPGTTLQADFSPSSLAR